MCRVEFSMEAGTVRKSADRHSGMVLYSSVLLSVKARCKTGLPFPQSRTRMESTGTGAPQHERRNALFNPPRNKSGRPLPWPPRPVLSCRAGLICGRIKDAPASDYPP